MVHDEIIEFLDQDSTPHKRLGDPLKLAGSKQSYHIRLLGMATDYTKHFSKSLQLLDEIAAEAGAEVSGVSLGIMQPYTWLKYHEGFWGYAQYVTRAVMGVEGPEMGASVKVFNDTPLSVQPGRITTFDDCKMHEAWNSSPIRRIALIFDMHAKGSISRGRQGIEELMKRLPNIEYMDSEMQDRIKVSIETAETIMSHI